MFEQTSKRYTGHSNPFQVDELVYHLLPMAVTNVSRKLQVHWVGPFKVTKIINECHTQVCVDGKSVVVHNGHLLKAMGDKLPIVALKAVVEGDDSLAPSEDQLLNDHHTMDKQSNNSCELHCI